MKQHVVLIGLLLAAPVALAQEYPRQISIHQSVGAGVISEHKAQEHIQAGNIISRGATVEYTAGQSIRLQPGFVAQAGSVFRAMIGPVTSMGPTSDAPEVWVRAYPNPFAGSTTVEYHLPTGGRVRHTLLDEQGRVIRQLDGNDAESAGRHQTQVDGSALRLGTYLYRLEVGSQSQTLRLLKKE